MIPKETITFYKGEALSGNPANQHIEKEYNIVQDETNLDGKRTIILQEKDLTQLKTKVEKLVNLIAEKIGEADSNTVRELLIDVLKDYEEKSIDRITKKLLRGEPIKVKEGCFKILVGDGRRKNSEEIMLRE